MSSQNRIAFVDRQSLPITTRDERMKSLLGILNGFEQYTLDINGKIISSNLEAVSVTGYEEWEVIGKSFSMFYTEEDKILGKFEQDLLNAEQTGYFGEQAWKVKKKGIRFWGKVKITPLKNSVCTLTGFKVTLWDSTHKAFYDCKVKAQRHENIFAFNNSTVGIIRFNHKSGLIEFLNNRASQLLEVSAENQLQDAFARQIEYNQLISKIEIHRSVLDFQFLTTSDKWVTADCKYFTGSKMVECLLIDITDIKKSEAAVSKIKHDLDTFLYHSSHELRAPISSVLGLLNLLDREIITDGVKSYTSIIHQTILNMDDLLKNLASIMFNSTSVVDLERIFLDREIDKLIQEFDRNDSQITARYLIENEFYTDLSRLRLILRNILSNAVKFRNTSDNVAKVVISVTTKPNGVTICITDNGIGMTDEQVDKACDAFYKGQNRYGAGLGLYLVSETVNKLGGEMTIHSTLDVGTTVKLFIPNLYQQVSKP